MRSDVEQIHFELFKLRDRISALSRQTRTQARKDALLRASDRLHLAMNALEAA